MNTFGNKAHLPLPKYNICCTMWWNIYYSSKAKHSKIAEIAVKIVCTISLSGCFFFLCINRNKSSLSFVLLEPLQTCIFFLSV